MAKNNELLNDIEFASLFDDPKEEVKEEKKENNREENVEVEERNAFESAFNKSKKEISSEDETDNFDDTFDTNLFSDSEEKIEEENKDEIFEHKEQEDIDFNENLFNVSKEDTTNTDESNNDNLTDEEFDWLDLQTNDIIEEEDIKQDLFDEPKEEEVKTIEEQVNLEEINKDIDLEDNKEIELANIIEDEHSVLVEEEEVSQVEEQTPQIEENQSIVEEKFDVNENNEVEKEQEEEQDKEINNDIQEQIVVEQVETKLQNQEETNIENEFFEENEEKEEDRELEIVEPVVEELKEDEATNVEVNDNLEESQEFFGENTIVENNENQLESESLEIEETKPQIIEDNIISHTEQEKNIVDNNVVDDNISKEEEKMVENQVNEVEERDIVEENKTPELSLEERERLEDERIREEQNKVKLLILDDNYWERIANGLSENFDVTPWKNVLNPVEYMSYADKVDFILLDHWFWPKEEPLAEFFISYLLTSGIFTPVICISDNLESLLVSSKEWNKLAERWQLLAFTNKDVDKIVETIVWYADGSLVPVAPYTTPEQPISSINSKPKDDDIEDIDIDLSSNFSSTPLTSSSRNSSTASSKKTNSWQWGSWGNWGMMKKLLMLIIVVVIGVVWWTYKDTLMNLINKKPQEQDTQKDKQNSENNQWENNTTENTNNQTNSDDKQWENQTDTNENTEKKSDEEWNKKVLLEQKAVMEKQFPFYKVVSLSDKTVETFLEQTYSPIVQEKFSKIIDPKIRNANIFLYQYKPKDLTKTELKKIVKTSKKGDKIAFKIIADIYGKLNNKTKQIDKLLKTAKWRDKIETTIIKQLDENVPFVAAINKDLKKFATEINEILLLFISDSWVVDLRQSVVQNKASISDILSWEDYVYFEKWLTLPTTKNFSLAQEQKMVDMLLKALINSDHLKNTLSKSEEKIQEDINNSASVRDGIDLTYKLDFYNQYLINIIKWKQKGTK